MKSHRWGAPGLYEPLRYQSNAVPSSEGFTNELEGAAPYEVPVDSVTGQLPTVSETDDADVASDELGFLKLRYKRPGETQSTLISRPVVESDDEVREDVFFSIAIAGFGQLLSQSVYLGDWSWDDAIEMANNAKGKDEFGYRSQAVQLMRLAKSLD